jgi:tRNA A37 N6-isopentenylltransferase MiaA
MKIEKIAWKQNVPTAGIDSVKAYQAMERLREQNGGLTDDLIVAAAKPKNHILHKFFEWSDNKAAVEYRRSQARQLMRSFEVVYAEAPEIKVRAYQVQSKARPGDMERTVYSTTEEVLSNPESRDRLIASAIKASMEFRNRFKHLHELEGVIEAIDKSLVRLGAGG